MVAYFWQGRLVRLRAVEPSDADAHFTWDQDADMERRLDRVHVPRSRAITRQWAERASVQDPDDDNVHFEIETLAGEFVGSVSVHNRDQRSGTFELGIAILDAQRRRGYASDAISLVLRYYFEELRYQKLTVRVYAFNEPSLRLFERLGFQHEGQLRRMVYTQGRFFDVVLLGLTKEEFVG